MRSWAAALTKAAIFSSCVWAVFISTLAVSPVAIPGHLEDLLARTLAGLAALALCWDWTPGRIDMGLRSPASWRGAIVVAPIIAIMAVVNLTPFESHRIVVDSEVVSGVVAATWEELLYRGLLLGTLLPLGTTRAVVASSLAFGIPHVAAGDSSVGAISFAFLATAIGLSFGALRVRSNSIATPILFHGVINATANIPSASGPGREASEAPLTCIGLGIVLIAIGAWLLKGNEIATPDGRS